MKRELTEFMYKLTNSILILINFRCRKVFLQFKPKQNYPFTMTMSIPLNIPFDATEEFEIQIIDTTNMHLQDPTLLLFSPTFFHLNSSLLYRAAIQCNT